MPCWPRTAPRAAASRSCATSTSCWPQGDEEAPLLGLAKLKPATAAQPEALLAAAAAGWALDVPTDLICAGLRTFDAQPPQGDITSRHDRAMRPASTEHRTLKERFMEVSRVRALRGPNLWSHHTSVEAIVACTPEEESIGALPGFETRLRALFPQIGAAAADRP